MMRLLFLIAITIIPNTTATVIMAVNICSLAITYNNCFLYKYSFIHITTSVFVVTIVAGSSIIIIITTTTTNIIMTILRNKRKVSSVVTYQLLFYH